MIVHLIGYKNIILSLLIIDYIIKNQLCIRQLGKLLETKRPKIIKKFVNAEDFEKNRVKMVEDIKSYSITNICYLVKNFTILNFNIHAGIWKLSSYFIDVMLGDFEYNEIVNYIVVTIIYAFIIEISDILIYYIEFDKLKESQYPDKTFINHILESKIPIFIGAIPGLVFAAIILSLVDEMLSNYIYYFCLLALAIKVIYDIKTTFFMELSSKDYELLTDGELKDQLEALAKRVNFPLDKIFITSHNLTDPKAKCTSIGFIAQTLNSGSIVLYKDAISRTSVEEACALVSSKLAHCKLNFNFKEFALDKAVVLFYFYIFIALLYNQNIANEFGFDNMPIVACFALFINVSQSINCIPTFFSNLIKRRHIIEADAVSKYLGYKKLLKSGLIKLNEESSIYYSSDYWHVTYHVSWLTMMERLTALKKSKRRKIN